MDNIGMSDNEEDSGVQSQLIDGRQDSASDGRDVDSDDDDQVVAVRRKRTVNRSAMIDSDSDDDSDGNVRTSVPLVTADDDSSSGHGGGMDEGSEEEMVERTAKKVDSRRDENHNNDRELSDNESNSSAHSDNEVHFKTQGTISSQMSAKDRQDVFDAESGSDDDARRTDHSDNENRSGDNDEDHDGGSGKMSNNLKRRLAKGAAKKPTPGRKMAASRPKKDEMKEIHSETQRLIRSSAVRLPYHKPEKKDLSVFLARTELKQQQLAENAAPASRSKWKYILSSVPTLPILSNPVVEDSDKILPDGCTVPTKIDTELPPSNAVVPSDSLMELDDVEPDDDVVLAPKLSIVAVDELSLDRLPDLNIVSLSDLKTSDVSDADSQKLPAADLQPTTQVAARKLLLLPGETCPTQTGASETVLQPVGSLNSPRLSSVDTSATRMSVSPSAQRSVKRKLLLLSTSDDEVEVMSIDKGAIVTASSELPSDISPLKPIMENQQAVTVDGSERKNSAMSPRKSLHRLFPADAPLPQLSISGGKNDVIDLDEDEEDGEGQLELRSPSGVELLMERLMAHSRGPVSATRKSRTIEVNTVCKEKAENGEREELKLNTFTYQVEADKDENVDPKQLRPGVQRGRLKAILAEQMRAKRDEALARRYELFGTLYGGAGYEAKRLEEDEKVKQEEEAELTDQTDTDDESDLEEEDDELDEEERTILKSQKEENPYIDDEAEDEDTDDDDDGGEDLSDEDGGGGDDGLDSVEEDEPETEEMEVKTDSKEADGAIPSADDSQDSLHLHLDTEDIVEDSQDSMSVPSRCSSVRSRLRKTKTLDLYDEDANTESPTVSQKSNENIELTLRPFERLGSQSEDNHHTALNDPLVTQQQRKYDDSNANSVSSVLKEASTTSADSSFDMLSSLIPGGQLPSRKLTTPSISPGRKTPELFTPSSKSLLVTGAALHSKRRLDGNELETAGAICDESTPRRFNVSPAGNNDSFQLVLENATETQGTSDWTTAGGLGGLLHRPLARSSRSAEDTMTLGTLGCHDDGNVDELLGLCSGTFSSVSDDKKAGVKSLFASDSQTSSDAGADELLGLCSGQFTAGAAGAGSRMKETHRGLYTPESVSAGDDGFLDILSGQFTSTQASQDDRSSTRSSPAKKVQKRPKRRRAMILDDEDDEEENTEAGDTEEADMFEVASFGDDDDDHERNPLSDDDDDGDVEENGSDSEEKKEKFSGFMEKARPGKIRQEFVDEEAELSGSEYASDEDVDLDEKDDILEMEAGDADDVGTEEDLRNQVHRVHLKTLIDQDDREIRLLQEQFLPDGDLHSDGMGRLRKFRWKDIDNEDDEQNATMRGDGDEEEDDGEREAKWRTERLEREKFIEEHKGKNNLEADDDDDSQLMRLGKAVLLSSSGHNTPVGSLSRQNSFCKTPSDRTTTPIFKVPSLVQSMPRLTHGSFLSRKPEALAKVAEIVKAAANPSGPRMSRNFVFQTVSAEEKQKQTAAATAAASKTTPVMQRSISVTPVSKRPRLDRSVSVPVTKTHSALAILDKQLF